MRRNLIFVAGLTAAIELEVILQSGITTEQRLLGCVFALSTAALYWRARWPLAVLLVLVGSLLVDAALGGILVSHQFLPLVAVVIATFSLGAYSDGWRTWAGALVAAAAMTTANQLDPANDYSAANDFAFFGLVVVAAPILAGRLLADRRRIATALEAQEAQVSLERDRAAETALLEERTRLAAALQDAIAQRVGEIAMQASGAERTMDREPARALAALRQIEVTARELLADVREVLGVLRRDAPAEPAEPADTAPPSAAEPPRAWARWIALPSLDAAIVAVILSAIAIETAQSADLEVPSAVAMLLVAGLALPIYFLRRWPLPVTAAVIGLLCLGSAFVVPVGQLVAPLALLMLLPFVIGLELDARAAAAGLAICVVGTVVTYLISRSPADDEASLIPTLVVVVAPWLAGRLVRQRDIKVSTLVQSVDRIERERRSRQRLATAKERARVARELHDVVGHSMTAIVLQSEAAQRVWESEPEKARAALRSVGEVSRETLTHLRETLAVIGETDAPTSHRIADLEALADRARSSELSVAVDIKGQSRELPAPIELAAYRLVQEALTNSARHAGPTSVDVLVEYGERHLRLEVIDSGPADDQLRGRVGGAGLGLRGMRERVEACGGWVTAGHEDGGGFAVRTSLPLTEPAA